MNKIKPNNRIVINKDIELIGIDSVNESNVVRVNIDTSVLSCLESYLTNIRNTLKDKPDMESIQDDCHMYSDINGIAPTLKEDVECAYELVNELVEDTSIYESFGNRHYKPYSESSLEKHLK